VLITKTTTPQPAVIAAATTTTTTTTTKITMKWNYEIKRYKSIIRSFKITLLQLRLIINFLNWAIIFFSVVALFC
jgi:hypothetical protein